MKPEKFISLELARKIKEAASSKNIELPESEYWYVDYNGFESKIVKNERRIALNKNKANGEPKYIIGGGVQAYDTYELGKILRKQDIEFIKTTNWGYHLKMDIGFGIGISHGSSKEPDARGKMLLYLLENDLLK